MKAEKVYGFWVYDLFPFVLGGPGRLVDKQFFPDGYGGSHIDLTGKAFIGLQTPAEGALTMSRIQDIRREHDQAVAMLMTGAQARLRAVLPQLATHKNSRLKVGE